MKPRHVARHLFQGESGYYARMAVPLALRLIIGKKELWAAIRANSDAGAVRKLPIAVAHFQAAIDAARAEAKADRLQASPRRGQPLSPRQSAVAHYSGELALDDQIRNAGIYNPSQREWSKAGYVAALQRVASGGAPDDECSAIIGWAIEMLSANGNVKAPFGSNEWRGIARQQAAIQLEVEKRKDERDRGEGDSEPRHPLLTLKPVPVASNDALAVRMIGPDSTKSLSEILPQFIKESGASPQTNYERQMIARLFEEHLGEPKPLYRITRQDVRGFQRALQDAPSNHAKRFPGMTLPQATKANKERITPYAPLDPKTINDKHVSKLRAMFNWCVCNDVIPDNPAQGIKIATVKDKKARRAPFSPSDLTKLFAPERFEAGKPYDESQWAMLCALFTGTRASELAQIKLDSVRHERGCLVIAIEEETKNIGSQRLIPVHSALIELGIEKRVAELRASGATHLFPEWYRKGVEAKRKAAAKGKTTLNLHFPRFIPKQFCVTILPSIGITDRSRKTWHSFRHTFTTGLDRAGVPRSMQDRLCGHADNSPHAGYVHGEPVEAMKEAIEKLRFDGFTLA